MPIPVHAYAAHLIGNAQMRGVDHDGQSVVKALKGEPLKATQYVTLRIRGVSCRLANNNLNDIRPYWAKWAADTIATILGHERCAIVPIPNKSAVLNTPANYQTFLLGQALQTEMGNDRAVLHDAFRWRAQLEPAHNGGPRGTYTFYRFLQYLPANHNVPYVLIDDVTTSGASIRACARLLTENGKNVIAAVCGGKTVTAQVPQVFNLPAYELDDFDPNGISFE